MSQMTIVTTEDVMSAAVEPVGQRPGADSGDPQLRTLKLAAEAGGRLGVWECQPGGWPVVNRPDTEVAYIFSGIAVITDDATGKAVTVKGGDTVILPPGWSGRWDIKETIRKLYAIY